MGTHAIAVIKNNKGEYLQYFEEKWNSYLFLNYKTIEKDEIIKVVSEEFGIPSTDIDACTFVGDKIHSKFSEAAKIVKEYHHYFFKVDIKEDIPFMNEETFNINCKQFKWFSYNELETDKRIQEVNSDVVSYIKEFAI